tara:strand:+ start:829 stop:1083 length:255 start_codon:yes stop_codon:yes gene_type:complete
MIKMKNENETELKICVQIADQFGHSEMMMNKVEALELIDQKPDHWIFMDGRLVDAVTITNANWENMANNETTLQLSPGLIGGEF